MEKIMKKTLIFFIILMTACVIAVGRPWSVYAGDGLEQMQSGRFMKALQQVDVKAEPDDNAETIFRYEEGDYVYVTGETGNGWLIVYYQGQTGYIDSNVSRGENVVQDLEDGREVQSEHSTSIILEAEDIDVEALNEEMAAQEVENKLIAEGVERYLGEARRSKIWGAIIVLLVIGIFAVGIVSTVGSEKKK